MSLLQDAARVLRMAETVPNISSGIDIAVQFHAGVDAEDLNQRLGEAAAALNTMMLAGFGAVAGAGTADAQAHHGGQSLRLRGDALSLVLIAVGVRLMIDTHHAIPPADLVALLAEDGISPPEPLYFNKTVADLSVAAAPAEGATMIDARAVSGLVPVALQPMVLPAPLVAQAQNQVLDLDGVTLPGVEMPNPELEDALLTLQGMGVFSVPRQTGLNDEPELWDTPEGLRIAPVQMDLAMLDALAALLRSR